MRSGVRLISEPALLQKAGGYLSISRNAYFYVILQVIQKVILWN